MSKAKGSLAGLSVCFCAEREGACSTLRWSSGLTQQLAGSPKHTCLVGKAEERKGHAFLYMEGMLINQLNGLRCLLGTGLRLSR